MLGCVVNCQMLVSFVNDYDQSAVDIIYEVEFATEVRHRSLTPYYT